MACQPVRGDNPLVLASELSSVQVEKHVISNLYHLHQYRPAHHELFCAKVGNGGIPDKKRNASLRFSPLRSPFNTKMLIVMKYSFLIKSY